MMVPLIDYQPIQSMNRVTAIDKQPMKAVSKITSVDICQRSSDDVLASQVCVECYRTHTNDDEPLADYGPADILVEVVTGDLDCALRCGLSDLGYLLFG